MPPKSILVLGGGLSGLSATFHLARRFPATPITLLEKSNRLGGWVRSERVEVEHSGTRASVLLESGPRTLRPNGKSVLELINLLGLHDSVITVPKSAPAAKHRFLHIPGTHGLTPLPHSIPSVFTSPIRNVLLGGALGEPIRALRNRKLPLNQDYDDMSFDTFLTYHFGSTFARVLGSALAHGVYAADSRLLSSRAAFPSVWNMAGEDGRGSVAKYIFRDMFGLPKSEFVPMSAGAYELGDVGGMMKSASVFSLRDGLESLMGALEKDLGSMKNVELVRSKSVVGLVKDNVSGDFMIMDDTVGDVRSFSHVASTVPLAVLDKLLQSSRTLASTDRVAPPQLPHLMANPTSSVTVVNFIFPPTKALIHPEGFGYLVPRKDNLSDPHFSDYGALPLEDRLIGVVFDSCALSSQDKYLTDNQKKGAFTKLTLMLKGVSSSVPEEEDLLKLLSKHLLPREPIPKPILMRVNIHSNCIPIPGVGHVQRIAELQKSLEDEFWGGRFTVLGAGVGGVSVPDCVEQGRIVASRWSSQ
ncbi:hypothetical protein QCA50_011413 [Cerrena zonata]|uniref:Protoporphyrinogen oxidase n=1 Tax=Cerrena zonata TaxID=2478898 RepID=A0AAW0G7B5_9APHY